MEKTVLAKVGDRELTKEDMLTIMRNLPQQQAQEVAGLEGRKRLLEEMVAGELFYLKALEKGYETEETFLAIMEETKRTMLQRYAVQKVLELVKTDEQELKTYYEANKAHYSEGPKAKAKHILMTEEAEILEVKKEIDAGLSFEDAATKYSTCPSKERGGDLGTFEKGRMVPEFEEAAFTQEIGVVSEPIQTQFGFHLIVVDERTDSSEKSFEEVVSQIEQELLMQKQSDSYRAEIEVLKGQYPVEMNEEGLK